MIEKTSGWYSLLMKKVLYAIIFISKPETMRILFLIKIPVNIDHIESNIKMKGIKAKLNLFQNKKPAIIALKPIIMPSTLSEILIMFFDFSTCLFFL